MVMKLPNSKRNLDMAIRRLTDGEDGYLALRTMLANVIVCQLMPKGAVKGGSALKVRFGNAGTRATTDLDAARTESLDVFVSEFAENLATGWNGFTARLVRREPAKPEGVPPSYVMQPFDVKLSYLGGAWCTVAFELGHNEIGDADNPDWVEPVEASRAFRAMGFPAPDPIPLMPLHYQVAQKLHGASELGSKRAYDLIDLQLIASNEGVDYLKTLDTCRRLFAYRKAHTWPPVIVKNEGWDAIYAEQALGLSVLQDVDEAIAWANQFVLSICEAR